ncbi:MAG: bacteriocin fulvocin C-related protein [Acidobacteriota bacterium]
MTTRTRRLLFVSVLFFLLALPAETMLLRAVQTPTQEVAIQQWGTSLDDKSLAVAGDQIQRYPFKYRQSIMAASTPQRRSDIWRRHLMTYLKAHQELDLTTVNAINAAAALATPEYLSEPTSETRAQVHVVADQIVSLLGRDQAEYLLFYLGPKDGTFASFEPMAMKIENKLRDMFTLQAFSQQCDCAQNWGCPDWRYACVNWSQCAMGNGWPQCGWFWEETCDGGCVPS